MKHTCGIHAYNSGDKPVMVRVFVKSVLYCEFVVPPQATLITGLWAPIAARFRIDLKPRRHTIRTYYQGVLYLAIGASRVK